MSESLGLFLGLRIRGITNSGTYCQRMPDHLIQLRLCWSEQLLTGCSLKTL